MLVYLPVMLIDDSSAIMMIDQAQLDDEGSNLLWSVDLMDLQLGCAMMNNSTTKKRILIFDALNAYLRAYIVDPSLSTNGDPIGGIKGFIKILQRHVRETSPDQIVIVWDGPNGSRKRKSVDKNYKAGRKPIRLNRAFHNLTDDEELRNKMWQQTRLIEYFNNMPIIQFMLPEVEADDVIAFITQMPEYKGWQKDRRFK